jgi:hypothetical protein
VRGQNVGIEYWKEGMRIERRDQDEGRKRKIDEIEYK